VADKSSFTKEEWTLLLESPMMAGMAITVADPSGFWGLLEVNRSPGAARGESDGRSRCQSLGEGTG